MSLFGDLFHITETHICWRWHIPNSWVMWKIGTFTNPCKSKVESLHLAVEVLQSPYLKIGLLGNGGSLWGWIPSPRTAKAWRIIKALAFLGKPQVLHPVYHCLKSCCRFFFPGPVSGLCLALDRVWISLLRVYVVWLIPTWSYMHLSIFLHGSLCYWYLPVGAITQRQRTTTFYMLDCLRVYWCISQPDPGHFQENT